MDPIAPSTVRYIKLGSGGSFVQASLQNGELPLGYHEASHDICAAGDWDAVQAYFGQVRKSLGQARSSTREVQEFYTMGTDCLWVTFADGLLWWGFAAPEVTPQTSGDRARASRTRRMIGGWRSTNVLGAPLRMNDMSTKLTQVASYQGTICAVKDIEYLLRKINAEELPILTAATAARAALITAAQDMIVSLHWRDFEIMVDLIFTRGGWQRTSVLGETMADIDLEIEQPTIGEIASVQVKSKANQAQLDEHIRHFTTTGRNRTYFVCHSPIGTLTTGGASGIHLWTGEHLAQIAVSAGLFDWLMDRVG